jgi:AcrR family transcriptional regulator
VSTSEIERIMPEGTELGPRLIATALELLESQPVEQLSIREVAKRAGVSHQAPYVHFGDKRRFLAAVAGAGLEQAATDATNRIAAAGQDPGARLHALADAYVAFIDTRPHVHDLVYGPLVAMSDHPSLQAAAIRYWTILRETVAANQPSGIDEAEVLRRCATAWGMVYGLARLNAAGKIPAAVPADRAQLLHDALEAMVDGWLSDRGQKRDA